MRGQIAALAVLVGLGIVGRAAAQQQSTSFFTGVDPRRLNYKAIDTSKVTKQYNLPGMMRPMSPTKTFSLANIFRPMTSLLSWPPRIGQSPQPAIQQPVILYQQR